MVEFENGTYQPIKAEKEESLEETIKEAELRFRSRVEEHTEIDYRSDEIDAEKIGETILSVQEDVEDIFRDVALNSPDLLPSSYDEEMFYGNREWGINVQ